MAIMTFMLKHGLPIKVEGGDATHYFEVGLRELSTGDILDARQAAERVVMLNGQAVAYCSDATLGLELLCRQVEYIGDIQGPLTANMVRKLHPDDFQLINDKAVELDKLMMQELEARGRD